jgi:hypothetical protein
MEDNSGCTEVGTDRINLGGRFCHLRRPQNLSNQQCEPLLQVKVYGEALHEKASPWEVKSVSNSPIT